VRALDPAGIDWDEAFRTGNLWHDRFADALRIEDRGKMLKTLSDLEGKLQELGADARTTAKLPASWASDAPMRKTVSQRLAIYVFLLVRSAVTAGKTAEHRALQQERNLQLAFALAAYRADVGRYPAKLAELSPRYLKHVPQDLFTGRPLVYAGTGDAYVLYSVGPNGKDDDGRAADDTPPGDDLVVRMPWAE
jgi:hypothetical protein